MLSQSYKWSEIDHCLYTKQAKDGSLLILVLYVDDMLIADKCREEISALKSKLHANFEMKDMVMQAIFLACALDETDVRN